MEQYYLEQVISGGRTFNTRANVSVHNIDKGIYYYATGYTIFYKIYLSDRLSSSDITSSYEERRLINTVLASHFADLDIFANPANINTVTEYNTFSRRNFYELELEGVDISTILTTNGGELVIDFNDTMSTHPVTLSVNNGTKYFLKRTTNNNFTSQPGDYPYFTYTSDLNIIDINTNLDVEPPNSNIYGSQAYVLMYIVAVGQNPETFSRIYSKPTLINIFIMPNN